MKKYSGFIPQSVSHSRKIFSVKGILRNRLVRLTWPIFIETTLILLLGIGDIFMLGGYSDYAVGAVGTVNQILNMVFLLFAVVTTGTSVLVARYLGERDRRSMKAVVSVSIVFNTIFGIALSVALCVFARPILNAMELRPELIDDAIIYMQIVGGFAFMQSLALTLSAILRSLQRPKFPMVAIVVVNIVNLVFNYVLIYGHFGAPELGAEGAAIATVASRIADVLILLISLFHIVLRDFSRSDVLPFRWDKLREVFDIGLPSAGEMLSYSISQVVVTYFINILSNEALIARMYVTNIVMVTYLFAIAVAQSCSITVGYLVGEHRFRAAHKLMIYCVRITLMVSLAIGLIIAIFGRGILSVFTENKEVLALACVVVWVDIVLEIGRALNLIVIQSLRAAGDYIFPVVFGFFSVWFISVGGSYLLGIVASIGLAGMWFAFAVDENVRGWTMLRRWNRRGWIDNYLQRVT